MNIIIKSITRISLVFLLSSLSHAEIKIEKGVEYKPMQPDTWKKNNIEPLMTAWKGKNLVFLTLQDNYDIQLMNAYVSNLDKGWGTYAEIVGRQPRLYKNHDGLPVIAAVPEGFTCGAGCGYVGATGIELAIFEQHDLPNLKKNKNTVPNYVYYEMGRNFYLYGDRHSYFATGFAVFMRYVAIDSVKSFDPEPQVRKSIEGLEKDADDKDNPLTFIEMFTSVGNEKRKGLKLKIGDSNNSLYASVMLKLRKEHGGDEWVKRFYAAIDTADKFKTDGAESAYRQSQGWIVAASLAAGENLFPLFEKEYRFLLTEKDRKNLSKVKWTRRNLKVASIVEKLSSLNDAEKENAETK